MRPDWDDYYLGIAQAVSRRGECTRRQVGAVIVKDRRIIATGYNGAPPGEPSCLDGACPRANSDAPANTDYAMSGCTVIHAEANAIMYAGSACRGATIYVTAEPCVLCAPLCRNMGLTVVTPQTG